MGQQSSVKPARRGHLAEPLSDYESDWVAWLYEKNIDLVNYFIKRLKNRYSIIPMPELRSCVNLAFVKAAIAWRSDKGAFSTIFYQQARGEVTHYIRSNASWDLCASRKVRELGIKIKNLIATQNAQIRDLPAILGVSMEEIKDALEATVRASSLDNEEIVRIPYELSDDDSEEDFPESNDTVSTWHRAS